LRRLNILAPVLLGLTSYGSFVYAANPTCHFVSAVQKTTFADYVVRVGNSVEGDGCLEVHKAGVLVHSESDAMKYGLGNNINGEQPKGLPPIPEIKPGTDITGNGIPNLIVSAWTGGAHCCFSFIVLELGTKFRIAARINAMHSDMAHFENHYGRYVFVGNDWTFAYWHAGFAQSPAPTIILKPTGSDGYSRYQLALDLMRKAAPSEKQFESAIQEIRADDAWSSGGVPPQLWGKMAEFIYTGQPVFAWKLLDQSWPADRPGKGGFLGAFCERIKASDYGYELSNVLKDSPSDCF